MVVVTLRGRLQWKQSVLPRPVTLSFTIFRRRHRRHTWHILFRHPIEGKCAIGMRAGGGGGCWRRTANIRTELLMTKIRNLLQGIRPGWTGIPLVHQIAGVNLEIIKCVIETIK